MDYKPKISLNMIVKNEGKNLERALASVADLVDEMIIIDTGSTDNTKEIALKFGAKVFDYTWHDHFAAARNEAINHSTGDWIFWIDGDEYFDEENRQKLKKVFASLKDENVVYMMSQINTVKQAPGEEIVFSRPSLFRNRPNIRWKYRVHEQILSSVEESRGQPISTDIRILHPGYHDPEVHKFKVERNIRLLHMENYENPNDPFIVFHLGLMYQSLKRYAEAIPFWEQSIRLFVPGHNMVCKGMQLWCEALFSLGDIATASQLCEEARAQYPTNPELMLLQARIYLLEGKVNPAEQLLLNLTEGPKSDSMIFHASFNPGIYTFHPHYILGEVYLQTNRPQQAEFHFRKALEYNPSYLNAIDGLKRLSSN